jgi:hypothetical protein
LVLYWEITADWKHDPSLKTELELRFSPKARILRASSSSTGLSTFTGHVVMRCVASLTRKATGVVSSTYSPARLQGQNNMSNIAHARKALLTRVLDGDGKASRALRRAAFDNTGLAKPVERLIDNVAKNAYRITDQDVDTAKASGLSEDEIFEIVVCAALGQASRQYEAALGALEAAIKKD